jgi:hypothetical protein
MASVAASHFSLELESSSQIKTNRNVGRLLRTSLTRNLGERRPLGFLHMNKAADVTKASEYLWIVRI